MKCLHKFSYNPINILAIPENVTLIYRKRQLFRGAAVIEALKQMCHTILVGMYKSAQMQGQMKKYS